MSSVLQITAELNECLVEGKTGLVKITEDPAREGRHATPLFVRPQIYVTTHNYFFRSFFNNPSSKLKPIGMFPTKNAKSIDLKSPSALSPKSCSLGVK